MQLVKLLKPHKVKFVWYVEDSEKLVEVIIGDILKRRKYDKIY
jgi:hypothetical protein